MRSAALSEIKQSSHLAPFHTGGSLPNGSAWGQFYRTATPSISCNAATKLAHRAECQRCGLILEAPAVSREPKDSVSGEDPERSSDKFFERINQPAMTIGSQSLHIFERDSTDKNDAKDKNYAPGVCKAKEGAKDCKSDDVLKMSVGPHPWPHQKGRQHVIYRIYKSDVG
jgi:hypothetical protein